ncbi:PAS domain-containing sensor histidine kinase [Romboutsia hominis]|uniref:histidine kinase n=1 Tax=Romboutsia faecis TaxID=2764597 RepID=A0ABR7JM11_9FIRM|nr:PAS domain-containing sensor histidine kinase [Romboutsia faecis]MBC5995646.1 PAS domain-containing sensor histidine kinase [Romboutsia faecis]
MNRLDNIEKKSSILLNVFNVVIFILLIYLSYANKQLYSVSVIISRLTLSILIITFTLGIGSFRFDYVNLIGIVYILSNVMYICSILLFSNMRYLSESILIKNILESATIFFIIDSFYKKTIKCKTRENSILIYFIYCTFILVMYFNITHNKNIANFNEMKFNGFEIILLISMILLMITMIRSLAYIKQKESFLENKKLKLINRVILLKMLYFIGLFYIANKDTHANVVYTFIEAISILETYFIYKITVESNLMNPYIRKLKINKIIKEQSLKHQQVSNVLQRNIKVQGEMKKEMEYKDDFLYRLLSFTPNGWIVFDKNKNIKYFNDTLKKICSYEEYDDIQLALKNTIINYDEFIRYLDLLGIGTDSIECEVITITEEYYKCMFSKYETSDEIVCILLDISNEKKMLNNLIELKQEYEDLITNIKSPIIILDEDNKTVLFSESYKEIFSEFDIYEEDLDLYQLSSNINVKALNNNELYNDGLFRYRVIDKKGNIIWLESKTTIYYEGDKKYTIISYSNITYYMNNRYMIKKSEDMYKALLDRIPEGIYLEDIETNKYVYINKKFKDIFGLESGLKEYPGTCRLDFMRVHPDYVNEAKHTFNKVKSGETSEYYRIKYLDKNDDIIDTQVASIPFKVNRKTLKLTIIKDMNDIIKLESLKTQIIEREKRDLIKMQFFINMSHELKTPLNLIFTSTQLIENLYNKNKISDDHGIIKKHVDLTIQNSYRLIKIINDLIDFTKMESGFYQLRLENKNVIVLIEDIVMSFANYADNNGINLIFDTNVEDLIMSVDVNSIERIILNILSNAIKFTGEGGSIYVNLIYEDNKINIIIEDTGIGIPEDKLEHIFDRFNDVNKGFIGNVYGSGIGLSMVKSMVNLIGGTIGVESKLNVGTKFTITMDVDVLEEEHNYIENYENISNIERLTVEIADVYKDAKVR